ncbi:MULTISPECIES: RHS repeat domain-containing protein [Pseudomonas syringae group]|uniref:Putative Insecticidal toxin protein n=6 Tax=Pseudomonas TaxID=286 RepID=A0A3M4P7Y3_PSEVI|nr:MULTISPECIES: RHS repeat-associated core domain-containing protein [Pseudomonas syringae group]RMO96696.1 putative Insecticidal toxin protein [Pseudomonas syringae pv. persicae]RMQ15469.1 putative Insecticidal toxin protein [Pseudomonas viridiflava]RMQ74341.1 putative Insecticidal toxin protein [Pseudomonas viridiflava]
MVSSAVNARTPELIVSEVRGLVVRQVLLHRAEATQAAAIRVTRQRFDPAGRMIAATDPRLANANRSTVYSLGGNALATESVDAGWRLMLFGEAGQVLGGWDGRGTERQLEYDQLLRPTRIIEQHRCVERFTYGQADAAAHNQCNQLIRHDDTAGSRLLQDYSLNGSVLSDTRHFLLVAEGPDWLPAERDRDALLEPVGLQTRWAFNAQGEALVQTDAKGNTQLSAYNVAGQSNSTDLTLNGSTHSQTLVSAIHYNAFNQVEQETAGNGVASLYSYDQQDGRLTGLSATSADGTLLQQLDYSYDPVGNILLVTDASQPDRYCDNQLIEPISRYRYDTLYQLIEATGREVRNGASHGPALPGLQPVSTLNPCQVSNYKQRYSYDAAGNLLQMRHEGAHNFTRIMHVAPDSNRSLPDDDGDVDFATRFDANGNLLQLVRGQAMGWDVRNQLQHITTVQRRDGPNDDERYVYDGQGLRCRKISTAQASGRTLTDEVRYLPGLEIRTTADGETLHVITAQAGRNSVRVLHWEAGKPDGIANDQVRYSLGDHLGSSTLELDQQGGLISQESYYPFGSTAWWAARSAVEAKYKTVRYSGKERDASGLYYYGFRYYAPWLQRWINPDPAGDVDVLNLFCFLRNTPTTLVDRTGLSPFNFSEVLNKSKEQGDPVQARGLADITRFNPVFGGTLAVALSSSQKSLAFARQKTNQILSPFADLQERETVLGHFRIPAEANPDTDSKILYMLSSSIGKLTSFIQQYDGTKIVGVGGSRNSKAVAWQYPEDAEHHLFIRDSVVHEHPHMVAWNIIHEASHMHLLTQDSWYMNVPGTTDEGTSGAQSYSGRLDILATVQRLQKRYEGFVWDGPDAVDVNRSAFEENPLARAQAILNNADSISLLVSVINQQFNGPMARLTARNASPSAISALDLASHAEQKHATQRRFSIG